MSSTVLSPPATKGGSVFEARDRDWQRTMDQEASRRDQDEARARTQQSRMKAMAEDLAMRDREREVGVVAGNEV